MATRPRTFASRGSFQRRSSGGAPRKPSLAVAAAVAVAILVIAILLKETMPRRDKLAEKAPPTDIAAFLPDGATASSEAPLEVPDLPQSSYVVGYAMPDGAAYVAYVRWDKAESRYRTTATAPLRDGAAALQGVPKLASLQLGANTPVAVSARTSMGVSTDGVIVLLANGDALTPADKYGEDGTVSPAVFVEGASARHSDRVSFDDADADGDRDAVVTAVTTDASGDDTRTVSVFAWEDGAFRYDQPLSWTLTVSSDVFPEPEN